MKIEICIPAFNEQEVISESVNAVSLILSGLENASVTVADNGSTDATAQIAASSAGVKVLSIPVRGKGAAVAEAARMSDADVFGFIDADLSADPREILTLLRYLESGECDIAIGSRLLDQKIVDRGIFRTVSSKIFNTLRRIIVGLNVEDTQCGLKLMNQRGKGVLAQCVETGWFFDMEFLARAAEGGLIIQEVPIHWHEHRFEGRGSKLNLFRDSIGALRAMFRIRKMIAKK